METLILTFKSKKNYKLIKELASRLEKNIDTASPKAKQKLLPKSKLQTEEEFRALSGIAKGQLISKEHLRNGILKKSINESKKHLPKGKFKSEEDFMRFAGSMKGHLISKEHLRDLSWKKRNW
jgi:hypothetical protein